MKFSTAIPEHDAALTWAGDLAARIPKIDRVTLQTEWVAGKIHRSTLREVLPEILRQLVDVTKRRLAVLDGEPDVRHP